MKLSLVVLLLFCSFCFAQKPIELDDERLGKKFSAAREYKLTRICLDSFGVYWDCRREIGPDGVRNTLGGMEFPWKHPGGRFTELHTKKFVWPPDVKAAKNLYVDLPAVQSTSIRNGRLVGYMGTERRITWKWPKGTTFFELHYHPKGWPFELRVLEKVGDGWGFDNYEAHIFRPFRGEDELPFVPVGVHRDYTINTTHPFNPFQAKGHVVEYNDAKVDWAKLVVNRKWEDHTGHNWHHAGLGDNWLSPKDYRGWLVGSSVDDCRKCHENTGASVDKFEPMRDWYGFLPGGDGVFSFDPIDRRTVKLNGIYMPQGGYRWADN